MSEIRANDNVVEQTVTAAPAQQSMDDLVLRKNQGKKVKAEVKVETDNTTVLLSKLVQIEEYRAELERLALEKDGFKIAPFRFKQ